MKIIIATNNTIKDIIKSETERLGLNADLNHINTFNVTNMRYVFEGSKFNGDISKWDTSNVTTMYYMFYNSKFNSDISKWDTSNVRHYYYIFESTNKTCKFKDEYYIEGKLVSSNEYKKHLLESL